MPQQLSRFCRNTVRMENKDDLLTIFESSGTFAQNALRQIMLRLRETETLGEYEEQILRICLHDCEGILALREQFKQNFETQGVVATLSHNASQQTPSGQRLQQIRDTIEKSHQTDVPKDVVNLIDTWQLQIERKMYEYELDWINRARSEIEQKQAEWRSFLQSGKASGKGIFAKIISYRWAEKVRKNETALEETEQRLGLVRQSLKNATTATKTLAGMAAVFLRIRKHSEICEHRIIRRVLEWDQEQDVKHELLKNIVDLESELQSVRQQLETAQHRTMDSLSEHTRFEEAKVTRLSRLGKEEAQSSLEQMQRFTQKQILKTYEPLHNFVDSQLLEIEKEQAAKETLRGEFERLLGVVHEYQKETTAEEHVGKRGSQAALGTQRTLGAAPKVFMH